jgi:hypothetical protein
MFYHSLFLSSLVKLIRRYTRLLLFAGKSVGFCGVKSGPANREDAILSGNANSVCGLKISRQEEDDVNIRGAEASTVQV